MLPDRKPGPLTYESGALPIGLRGPADLTLGQAKKLIRFGDLDLISKSQADLSMCKFVFLFIKFHINTSIYNFMYSHSKLRAYKCYFLKISQKKKIYHLHLLLASNQTDTYMYLEFNVL